MQLETFVAESATDAVSQIRAKLGPEAVVVNVRQQPRRLWQRPRIEVLAHAPQPVAAGHSERGEDPLHGGVLATEEAEVLRCAQGDRGTGWRVGAVLENLGLLPRYAERVVEELQATYGDRPPGSLAQELRLARDILCRMWPTRCASPARSGASPTTALHVFIGAPGVGKTTALCKWLTQAVLLDGCTAHVWRLDSRTANTAETLGVHGDILGVPVERSWTGEPVGEELLFVDLPGVGCDAAAVRELAEQLTHWPSAQLHLVLNGAYETTLLLAHVRAYSVLPISDLIVTHLDEEPRWGKLWNLVLGTSHTIRFLGARQNIPGEFFDASPDRLLARDFPLK